MNTVQTRVTTTRQSYKRWLLIFVTAMIFCQTINGQNLKTIPPTDSLTRNGSALVVTERQMNKGLVNSSLDALSGQAAGVTVTSGENRMAILSSVRVRGTTSLTGGNDPLVIIDGVYSDIATLSTIYPADIESFTILRNAAETAPYGSRGASGVIQVTTKKGHEGQFHIAYDGNIGFESVYKNLEMMHREDYLSTAHQLGLFANDGGYDTDFPSAITRTGFIQNHHIAFSGGTDRSNYRASLGFMDRKTVERNNGHHNFVAKIDLNQKAFDDRLTIDMGVFGSSQSNDYIFDEQKLFYSAASQNPTFPTGRNSQGGWDKNSTASQINPPFALLAEKDHEKNLNFNTHLRLDYTFNNNLNLVGFGAYSYSSMEGARFAPTWVWAQGQAWRSENKEENWLANMQLKYHNTWGKHSLNSTVMAEYQYSRQRGFYTSVKGFATNDMGYDNLGAGAIIPYGGTGSRYDNPKLLSFLAGTEYTLANRYSLNLNIRADGSSMVGKNNRWGLFPSLSASWDVMRETWMRHQSIFTMLKFRTGYGLSGNLGGIESYNSLEMLQPAGVVPWNGGQAITMAELRNVNPDLKWETRGTFNIGADMAFWNNRLVLTAEYYYSKTWDMIYQYDVPVPPFTYNKLLANIGEMSNQGFELGIGITPVQKKDLELNVNVNLSFQNNKLISLSGDYNGTRMTAASITAIGGLNGAGFHGGYNDITYQIVGQPLGTFYLPHCTGLKQNADGTYNYDIADLDHNGAINIENGGDRYIVGQATPKVILGSNIGFRYKDFDISLQMNGAFGHKIYNGTALTYMNMGAFPDYNVMADAPVRNIKDQTATDYWLESGDYLNFDYLTMGWNVPISSKSKFISALRISASVNNLATITGYSGLTPMINSSVVDATLGIDDKRSYPPYRSYSIGLSIQF